MRKFTECGEEKGRGMYLVKGQETWSEIEMQSKN